jgi:hypothetical protein
MVGVFSDSEEDSDDENERAYQEEYQKEKESQKQEFLTKKKKKKEAGVLPISKSRKGKGSVLYKSAPAVGCTRTAWIGQGDCDCVRSKCHNLQLWIEAETFIFTPRKRARITS